MQALYNNASEGDPSRKNTRKQNYNQIAWFLWVTTHIYQTPHTGEKYFWPRQLNSQIEMQTEMQTELCVDFLIFKKRCLFVLVFNLANLRHMLVFSVYPQELFPF